MMLGTLPPEWGRLGGLHGLDLCRTSLTGAELPQACSFAGHRALQPMTAALWPGTLPPEWGWGLGNLTALSLGETALSGTLPASWASLHNLSFFLAEATQLWGQVMLLARQWLSALAGRTLAADCRPPVQVPASWAQMRGLKMVNLEGSSVHNRLHWSWSRKCADPAAVVILPVRVSC